MWEALERIKKELLKIFSMLQPWKLYEEAVKVLGTDVSPQDIAVDEVGCVESLSRLLQRAYPDLRFPTLLSTRSLYDYLLTSPSFIQVDSPQYGDIILSVTGTGNGTIFNGHCGVVGQYTSHDKTLWVMSNDSFSGTWEVNFTIGSWKRRYVDRGGMELLLFRPQ